MTLKIDEKTEIIGFWFLANNRYDWMAYAYIDEDGKITAAHRHRYYNSLDPWDEKDEKRWYALGPIENTPEERKKLKETFDFIFEHGKGMVEASQADSWAGGTGAEFVKWMEGKPFFHHKYADKDGKLYNEAEGIH